jgi:Na+/H+ antiporter NhaD/arsenite permease-like protein
METLQKYINIATGTLALFFLMMAIASITEGRNLYDNAWEVAGKRFTASIIFVIIYFFTKPHNYNI